MVRCAWESRSTRQTRWPISASAAPRLTVVVVLPTPPFWFIKAMQRIGPPPCGEGEKSITGQFSQDLTQKQPSCFSGGVVAGGSSPHASAESFGQKRKASAVAGKLFSCSVACDWSQGPKRNVVTVALQPQKTVGRFFFGATRPTE